MNFFPEESTSESTMIERHTCIDITTDTHTETHPHTQTHTNTETHIQTLTDIHTDTQTQTHTIYIHTYTHYTHTHTHTHWGKSFPSVSSLHSGEQVLFSFLFFSFLFFSTFAVRHPLSVYDHGVEFDSPLHSYSFSSHLSVNLSLT